MASPLETGGRPFEVISVDPKPMDMADMDTGYDSLPVCVDRWTGMTLAIPHYKTDTAEEMGRLLNRHVFDVYGAPRLNKIRTKGLTDALNMWCHPTGGQHWVRELSRALLDLV